MEDLIGVYGILDRDHWPEALFQLLDGGVEDAELMTDWLSEKAGRRVQLTVPQRGELMQMVRMATDNAAEQLAQRTGTTGHTAAALNELGRLLGLPEPPHYIESYDISNLAGDENVAGMVVFENGRPLKSAYRKFKIRSVSGQDDYRSMQEVIVRRFAEYEKCKDTHEGFGRMPDLLLLDGGRGHVNAIRPLLRDMGYDVPVFGMVKDDKHRTRAIAQDGGEIAIRSNRAAFTLVSSIQEEVHRFAIGYHRQRAALRADRDSARGRQARGHAAETFWVGGGAAHGHRGGTAAGADDDAPGRGVHRAIFSIAVVIRFGSGKDFKYESDYRNRTRNQNRNARRAGRPPDGRPREGSIVQYPAV